MPASWPGGNVTCPRCEGAKHSFIKTRRIWFCYDCKKQFTVKVGTIMEDSPIGLDKWMTAMWMLANCKNGISSYELAKNLGIRQNSAWFMLHRIREAMKDKLAFKLGSGEEGGPSKSDETFVSAQPGKMHNGRRLKMKKAEHAGARPSSWGCWTGTPAGPCQSRSERQARNSPERDSEPDSRRV